MENKPSIYLCRIYSCASEYSLEEQIHFLKNTPLEYWGASFHSVDENHVLETSATSTLVYQKDELTLYSKVTIWKSYLLTAYYKTEKAQAKGLFK